MEIKLDSNSIGKRFLIVRKHFGLTQEEFGEMLLKGEGEKVDKSTIAKYEKDKMEIPARIKVEIFSTFKVNKAWLETGEGEMFVSPEEQKKVEAGEPVKQEQNKRRVPVLGEGLAGTDMELNVADNSYVDEYIDVGDLLRDSEAAFVVYGNSMTPAYPPGCVVGIKRNYDSFIQPGETYLLLTKSNRVLKRLYETADKSGYRCFSDNILKHEHGPLAGEYFYPPFEVSKKDILSIFDVTGMIKRNRNSVIIQRQK